MKVAYLPNIFDNNGKAELIIRSRAQLAKTVLNGVLYGFGLILRTKGVLYNPIDEVTIK